MTSLLNSSYIIENSYRSKRKSKVSQRSRSTYNIFEGGGYIDNSLQYNQNWIMIYESNRSEVVEAINYLNEFSEKEGLYLIPNLPEENPEAINEPVDMDIKSFLALAKTLDCKIVYYQTTLFTSDDFKIYIEYLDKNYRAEEIKMEDNKWHKKINKFVCIKIFFIYNRISHMFLLKEDCLEDLEQGFKKYNEKNQMI